MAVRFDRVVVTGARGFLGRNLVPVLVERYGADKVIALSRSDFDLSLLDNVRRMVGHYKPDVLVHLAAYVGGIGANKAYPADFYFRNMLLQANVFQAAAEGGVGKIIYPMGGCSYPADATSPIDENQMWEGLPQAESSPYSSVKKLGIIAASAYEQQHGIKTVVLVPGNVYGPHDNFREHESHVIAAMLRRYIEAKRSGAPEVMMWGSGRPERDFVYVGDVAATVPFFMEQYEGREPVNISSGTSTSIRELAELVKKVVGYEGRITWDSTRPDGQLVKIFATKRLHSLGLSCSTPIEEGLRKTADWFCENYQRETDGIRL